MDISEVYFPHESVREAQKELVSTILEALEKRADVIAHAPTGLGKTAAALAPALTFAKKEGLTVFFLTSRHTQHFLAIDTLKKIRDRHHISFSVTDIIGKKSMCAQPGLNLLRANEFAEVCRAMVEKEDCEYYLNVRKRKTMPPAVASFLEQLKSFAT